MKIKKECILDHKAFEKAHLFLLQACYSDLINVDPRSANAPLMSKLPWASYEANAWGASMEVKNGQAVYQPRLFGSFGATPMSVSSASIQPVACKKTWYTNAKIHPSVIEHISTLTPAQCVQSAQECLAAQERFLDSFFNGAFDEHFNIGDLRQSESIAYGWMRAFGHILSAPVDWLMSLPHADGILHYLDQSLSKVGTPQKELEAWLKEQMLKDRMQDVATDSKEYKQWEKEKWKAFLLRQGTRGAIGCGAILERCAKHINNPGIEQESFVKSTPQVLALIDTITSIQGRLWMKKAVYQVRNEAAVAVNTVFAPFMHLLRPSLYQSKEKIEEALLEWEFSVGEDDARSLRTLPLTCMRKSATLNAQLEKNHTLMGSLDQKVKDLGVTSLEGMGAQEKLKKLQDKQSQIKQTHAQWVVRALRLVSLSAHWWSPTTAPAGGQCFVSCAAHLPAECSPLLGAPRRSKTRQLTSLGAKWAQEERYDFSPLGHMSEPLLAGLPLPLLFGLVSEMGMQSGVFKGIDRYVRSKCFDASGTWVAPQLDSKGCSSGLRQTLEAAALNPEPSGNDHWALSKKQWLQLMVALAIKGGDQKSLKAYLKDPALKDASLKECLDFASGRSLLDALSLMQYNVQKPKFAWMKKWLCAQGVPEEDLASFVSSRDKEPAFTQMLEGWGARIRAQDLKKTLTEHAKQSGRKIKARSGGARL